MSLPPINGDRTGVPRRGQQPGRQPKRQANSTARHASPESFDDSVSGAGVSSTSTAATNATTTATAVAADRRDACEFRIVVAARIRPFTAREVRQWRQERRSVTTPEDAEEARRARAALRQPFGPGHKSLNATQGGLDSTWTRRHDTEEESGGDAGEVPHPVVEVESDGTTIALLDPQSVAQDGATSPAVRNAFTYDYVYSSFAPNVVLDTQCSPGGGGGRGPSPYVILDGDDEAAAVMMDKQPSPSAHTPAQELQAEAEQVAIYEQLAIPLVDAAMHGYNTCMFAYGQTGSGKTYTMMGTPRHPGLIPRLCRRLFSEIDARNEEGGGKNGGGGYKGSNAASPALVTLQLSYMEIYNEQVRDLLKQRPKNAILHYKSRFDKKDVDSDEYRTLKVRHHPSKGIYVDGLTSVAVGTWDECEAYLQAGNALRTQCSTAMNAKSSRSHAIFQLQMTQRESTGGRVRGREVALETFSKINLVDLAGSERNTQAKSTGKHLAEANSINASLSTLRRVLDGLIANRAAALSGGTGRGKKGAVVIPYRESLLTYVLSDNLGGNSFTVMCANVSPCASSAGETESTLRYATLAKAVVNHARLNEAPTARVLREMRDQLRSMQEALRTAPDPSHVAALEEGVQLSEALLREMKTREGDYEAQLEAQKAEAAALQKAVEAHRLQETYWRDEAQRQQREVEQLREALFEATQNGSGGGGAQSNGLHLPSLTDKRGGGAAAKKRSKSQQQQQHPQRRRGSSVTEEVLLSPSSSTATAAAAAASAAVSARDGRPTGARATPLSLLGNARGASKKRPSQPALLEAPASAPEKKARRPSFGSGPVIATAPSSGEARALAARTRVNGVAGRPPLSTAGYGDAEDDGGDVYGDVDDVEEEEQQQQNAGAPASFFHTEHVLAGAASDAMIDGDARTDSTLLSPDVRHVAAYEQLDLLQLQEEAAFSLQQQQQHGGLEIEGVAATPSRRQWPTKSPRVAAARKNKAAEDRRRSSTTAAAAATAAATNAKQQTKGKKTKLKKKAGKSRAAMDGASSPSRGVSEERSTAAEEERGVVSTAWPQGEISTSFELPSAPAAAMTGTQRSPYKAQHNVAGEAAEETRSRSPRTPHGDEGLTEMQSANPEDPAGDELGVEGAAVQRNGGHPPRRLSASSDGFLHPFVDQNDKGEVYEVGDDDADEDDWNTHDAQQQQQQQQPFDDDVDGAAEELTGDEMCADDVDSAAASLNRSTMAAHAVSSLHKTTKGKKAKAHNGTHHRYDSPDHARHYSTVDMLH